MSERNFLNTYDNNKQKRIIKNTAMLYLRMILLVFIGLYTSRIILEGLGFTDYGIYNVIGGFVSMIGFLNSSLSGASARFVTFDLGKNDLSELRRTFRCAVSIHYLLAIFLFLLAETIGLWFFYNKLVIPVDRLNEAFWVYQCSVFTIFISIISAPYNSLIIAHEKMSAFAYISIFEAIAKLIIAFIITYVQNYKLSIYALLILSVQVCIRILYSWYCSKHFPETSWKWLWDKEKSKKIFSYAGWTLNGNIAVIGYTQGINILLNLFFGPVVNAARGISVQIQNMTSQFCLNFSMAAKPQIIKSYANQDYTYMHKLITYSSKISFFLMLLIIVPLLVNMDTILNIWLNNVPEHTASFTRIILITSLNYALNTPTITAIHATGKIKQFQIIEGTLLLSVVPIAYILLKFFHINPEQVFLTYLIIETVTQFIRVWIIYPQIGLTFNHYIKQIIYPILRVIIPTCIFGIFLYRYTSNSIFNTFLNCISCILCTGSSIYFLGLNQKEKSLILTKINNTINHNKKSA